MMPQIIPKMIPNIVLKIVPNIVPNIPTKTNNSITTPPASRGVVCCAFHFVGIFGIIIGTISSTNFDIICGTMFGIIFGVVIPEKAILSWKNAKIIRKYKKSLEINKNRAICVKLMTVR